jgi:hypothetical protein
MSAAITGTNTDKIDQLIQQVAELRATLRIYTGIIAIGFPLLVALVTFLVTKTFDTSARLDQMSQRLDSLREIERDLKYHRERMIKLEAALTKKDK